MFLALLVPAASAAAAKPATFALQPITAAGHASYFVLAAQPGQTLTRRLRVVNTGGRRGTVLLYPVDGTTGQTSGAVYLDRSAPRRDVGRWLRVSSPHVTLDPGQSRTVSFDVAVPRRVAGGQHLGGLVAENAGRQRTAPVKRGRGSFRINLRALTIAAVQVTLPGQLKPDLIPDSAKPGGTAGYQALLLGIRNDGNALVKGSGSVAISTRAGGRVSAATFALDTFVPRTRINYPVPIRGKALAQGRYSALVTIRYPGHSVRRRFEFSVSDKNLRQVFGARAPASAPQTGNRAWLFVAGGIALLALGFAFATAHFRRRERRLRELLASAAGPRERGEQKEPVDTG